MDSATGSIDLGDSRVNRRHLIIWNTLYLSLLLVSCTLAELLKIHALLWSVHRSTQFVWYIMAGYPFLSSHPSSTPLVLEPLFLTNYLWIPCELQRFSTLWSRVLRDGLRGRDRMSLETIIERVWRYTWRLWSSNLGDALGGRDRASLEMHLDAVIVRVWRCTWRPSSCEFGNSLGGRDRASLEMDMEAVIVRV